MCLYVSTLLTLQVSVAKNFDAPIKLLFPRGVDLETGKRAFSMLGLGDIVIPGLFVALMLRRDAHYSFAGHYFTTAFIGYVLGLGATIVVMNVFNAAQPALLYIVPGVLGCVGAHAWARGELMQVSCMGTAYVVSAVHLARVRV